tara:strand:+ start:1131 stop:1361 length:231 start_codon:yes stop_codon:yes gene_type:complete
MNITIDPAATKILNTLNKSATVRGIQEDFTTLKGMSIKQYRQTKALAEILAQTYSIKNYNAAKITEALNTLEQEAK